MRRLAFSLGLLSCVACGEGDLLYIERFVPFDGPSLARVEGAEAFGANPDGIIDRNLISPALIVSSENNAADTSSNICVEGDECSSELFTAHFAWITLRNDEVAPEGINVTDTVNRYRVVFEPETTEIDLPTFEANVRAVVGPGQTTTFQLTLVPFEYKQLVGTQLGPQDPPLLYRAQVTLFGDRNLELSASTTLLIGRFNNCEEGQIAIDQADAFAFCEQE